MARSQQRREHLCCSECTPRSELPPELQGLYIDEAGLLIDEKSGKAINEFGATRFDVPVRALRGEFDPPPAAENTERAPGLLLDSLMAFPGTYTFNVVLRTEGAAPADVAADVAALVARVCQTQVDVGSCVIKERKGGKFVSLEVPALVRSAEVVHQVFAELETDTRVVMKF
ncbi:hypothetical protein N2152v2_008259 [Parachlorella kessleri]